MHVLYLHQYFTTRSDVGGTRSYEFARYLQRQGHTVTLVTAAAEALGNRKWRKVETGGVSVIELNAGYRDYLRGTEMGYGRRTRSFISFALAATRLGLVLPKPDVIFATSTPLTIGIPGVVLKWTQGVPLVFEVRDLWPEAPIQMGALRSRASIALARWLERLIYRNSEHIVALSPGMKDGIVSAGIAEKNVTVIPNASDLDLFSPSVDGTAFRSRLGLDGQFVCTYFGAMGAANGLGYVLDAAEELQARRVSDVIFILHGQGKERSALETRCRSRELTNVVFSDPIPDKAAIAQLAAASDVCMTIYKNVPVLYTCSPNKFFDSLAAGKPVLVNMPGWLQKLVEEYDAGVFVRPDDPIDFTERLLFLRDHPDLCIQYGKNARRLAEEQFSRHGLARELEQVLLRALSE